MRLCARHVLTAHGRHIGPDVAHRVEDGHPCRDRAAGRVDVQRDVALGVLRVQVEQLRDDQVGHVVVHGAPEADDALHEELRRAEGGGG